MNPNRANLLTPAGVGAIAVVRLRGPATRGFLNEHFSKPVGCNALAHGIMKDGRGGILDDCVVFLRDEHCAEINLHGGAWTVQEMLALAERSGFKTPRQSTLPLPADDEENPDSIAGEIEAYLPMAQTELGLRTLLAQAEAWRNFPPAHEQIDGILNDRSLHWLLHPPKVAVIGAANVGKSTLANWLFGQERAITADLPGTTRDWIGEIVNLDGLAVELIDTPGLRSTTDAIEQEAIRRSEREVQTAALIVLVFDGSRPLEPEQTELFKNLSKEKASANCIPVINKSDMPPGWDYSHMRAIRTVGTNGYGVDELTRAVRAFFGCDVVDFSTIKCWTQRQRDLLAHAKKINAARCPDR